MQRCNLQSQMHCCGLYDPLQGSFAVCATVLLVVLFLMTGWRSLREGRPRETRSRNEGLTVQHHALGGYRALMTTALLGKLTVVIFILQSGVIPFPVAHVPNVVLGCK